MRAYTIIYVAVLALDAAVLILISSRRAHSWMTEDAAASEYIVHTTSLLLFLLSLCLYHCASNDQ